ncbi:MAG: ISNCY family transposase [Clostridiales Family XIII bacterium]|nr:ISNCY family transposase [Clostridiales Family XIII bacterium]
MGKAELTMAEQKKYDVIKSIVDHGGNKNRAVIDLGCSRRTVDRLVSGYKQCGKAFFPHKNKGRKPATQIPDKTKKDILDLYNAKYYDVSYAFFRELLEKHEGIFVSAGTIRNILMAEYILSPRANRKTIKDTKKALEMKAAEIKSTRILNDIHRKLVSIEDAHPRRPRSANFGEELQMDASVYAWFGGIDAHLHAAIDDATGNIVGMYFDWQETLHGYYHVFGQILKNHGIPYKFRTDKRTVFEYKRRGSTRTEEDTYTQFAYACKQLGVGIETTSIPQGKGRIERLFETLQGRLPILFRLAGINTIEAANEFLGSYIEEFNAKFGLGLNGIPSVFETQPSNEKINLTLAVLTERKMDAGHAISFFKKYYRLIGENGQPVFFRKGTTGLVVKAFDGSMYFQVDEQIFALEQIPLRTAASKDFTAAPMQEEQRKPYIPAPSHPWKTANFEKFARSQRHRIGSDIPTAG